MRKQELKRRIRTAAEHAAPDRLDRILSSCDDQKREGEVFYMSEQKANRAGKRKRNMIAAAAAIAAVFLLCFAGYHFLAEPAPGAQLLAADSVIMLDVNPSLSLYVNEEEKVVSVEALNDDAKNVLGDMELTGTSLDVAVNAIIGSMLQKGYLGDMQNSVLVSVESEDAARGEQLQREVSEAITKAMQGGSLEASVLSQTIHADDALLAELAEQYGISMGKAALIQEVIGQAPELTFEKLAPMTVNEIALLAASRNIEDEALTQTGKASDKAYISQSEALAQVCAHAGIDAADIVYYEIEFDYEDGIMVYEIEFKTQDQKYEYEIDAASGEVLKYDGKNTGGRDSADDNAEASAAAGRTEYIGEAAAQAAALADAGVEESETYFIHTYFTHRNGKAKYYHVEFAANSTVYYYEIDLYSGAIVEKGTAPYYEHSHHGHGSGAENSGTDSTAYIGEEAAYAAALAHAGIEESSLTKKKIELDEEHGKMVYEIELKAGRNEYEYEVDALTGEILEFDIDYDD